MDTQLLTTTSVERYNLYMTSSHLIKTTDACSLRGIQTAVLMFETAWDNKGLSYFAREYSFKTSWVDLCLRIMISMATQHAGTDQKCLTMKWSASCKAAEQVTLLAGSEMKVTNWAAVDLTSSSSSCSKHRVELRTLQTQVKTKIRLGGNLIADNMCTIQLKRA